MDEITVKTFESKCASCGHVFSEPILSDFSYGQHVFRSQDGKHFLLGSAFEPNAELISYLLPYDCKPELFWFCLASLSDKVNGETLSVKTHCPECTSTHLEYRHRKDNFATRHLY